MSETSPALKVEDLEMRFGAVTALSGLSLAIERGEIHGIVGHNGSGKSTFVEILSGTHLPNSGKLELFGNPVSFPAASRDKGKYPLAVVHQDVGLVGSMSVVDNFRVNRFKRSRGGTVSWAQERKITRERLLALGVDVDPRALVEELSAADQVLISVARALMDLEAIRENADQKDEAILILDEPTSSLPSGTVDSFLDTIRAVNNDLGTTVIIISHNPREIMSLSRRFSALKNGRLVGTYLTGEVSYPELAALMAGRNEGELEEEIKTGERGRSGTVSPTSKDVSQPKANRVELLRVEGLQGGRIENADFTLYSGEIVGITGLLGSGYEDVPYLLCGSQPKQGGSIVVDGTVLQKANPRMFKSLGAVLLPGDRQLTSGIQAASVRENMTMGYLAPFSRKGMLNHKSERDVVSKMMGKLRIRPQNPERPLNEFSGGQQQKALIGRCLLRSAKLIVIDEPCTGIDVGARDEIHRTLREVSTGGSSVLIVSCQYEELPMICDRLVVFQGGRIVGELAGQEVTEEAILRLCYTDSPVVST